MIRAGVLFPVASYVQREGGSAEALVVRNGLPAFVLGDPELLIPMPALVRLLADAANDGVPAALAGQTADVATLGMFGRLVCASPTLGAALGTLVEHYDAFMSTGRVWVASHGADVEFCHEFPRIDERWQQTAHYALTLMIAIIRRAAGPAWRPAAVRCQAGRSDALAGVDSLADASIAFAQPVTGIVVPRELLGKPFPAFARPAAAAVDDWRAAAPAIDFVRAIGQVIETLSCDGFPSIETTASTIGTSVRTLQRQLAKAGRTHEQLLAQSRCAIATALLEKTDSKILDIALDLGYSDHAHFTRAFRRWTGHSPQEFRQSRSSSN